MKKYLFFDTETAGFNGPIMQLAWILTDENGEVLEQVNRLVSHEIDYEVNEQAFFVHGLTKEICDRYGKTIEVLLAKLFPIMDDSSRVIAHNIDFDWKMIMEEVKRYELKALLPSTLAMVCTMRATTEICKIPHANGRGFKWPKLQELHQHLFGQDFEGAHDALADVLATARCFFELKKRGVI